MKVEKSNERLKNSLCKQKINYFNRIAKPAKEDQRNAVIFNS